MATFVKDIEEIRQRAIEKIQDGPVTATYKGDIDRSIDVLNEALATEIVCVLRYLHHYFMATGVHGRAVAEEFKEHADEEREHADLIGERIQQLGGKPDFNPGSLLQRSVSQYVEGETLADMIREDLIAERMVIEVYQEMIRFFGNNDPTTRRMIEQILADEEEHAADLSDLLFIVDPETGETEGQDPGTDPLELQDRHHFPNRHRHVDTGDNEEEDREVGEQPLDQEERRMTARQQQNARPENVRGRDREYNGVQQAPQVRGSRESQNRTERTPQEAVGSVGITNRDRIARRDPARTPPSGSLHGGSQGRSEPTGGVEGRPMNRRRDIEDDDVAPRQPANRSDRGGMTGGTRSAKVLQKNRKGGKRVA